MFTSLPEEIQKELAELALRYGQPLTRFVELAPTSLFDPLNRSDRYGEVCMVIRRSNGSLLTAKKTFYPANAYRLLTGGINYGERVLHALLRETREETNLEVIVQRFLVAVAYCLPGQQNQPLFYTFAFLLDEAGGSLEALDKDEYVEYFREITPEELPERENFFAHLPQDYSAYLGGKVADWGQFRAIIHELVAEALAISAQE